MRSSTGCALDYPDKDGEWLFQKARLVNAALIAKIHTTEWTPALMNSPEGRFAMRGQLVGPRSASIQPRATAGSAPARSFPAFRARRTDHHAAPYAMTEEFTAVYRMHSLIPDDFSFRRASDDGELFKRDVVERRRAARPAAGIYAKASFDDILYSFGTSHPGALVLHNFPNTLRKMPEKRPSKGHVFIDLAATDILRDRERGVPRYCAFRRIWMFVPKSFAELTDDPVWQRGARRRSTARSRMSTC